MTNSIDSNILFKIADEIIDRTIMSQAILVKMIVEHDISMGQIDCINPEFFTVCQAHEVEKALNPSLTDAEYEYYWEALRACDGKAVDAYYAVICEMTKGETEQ